MKQVIGLTEETVEEYIDEDVVEIEYRVDHRGHCQSALLVLSQSSPYAELDTKKNEIRLYWPNVIIMRYVPEEVSNMLFDFVAMDFLPRD